jgi:hypothetical protein
VCPKTLAIPSSLVAMLVGFFVVVPCGRLGLVAFRRADGRGRRWAVHVGALRLGVRAPG